ncbi:hypothetical protein L7F22_048286 [Adiantum nelumboides]|nr:hypothetical protein [Adiantum nelumboides]
MTQKSTTWADFCVKFKDFAKMDPLKAYAKLQSLSIKTLSFDKYTTAFKEALTFCKVDAMHVVHMYLLGLHEDYCWAFIKDKTSTDVKDAVAKARTFHLINGANYEKKRNIDHQSGERTSRKRPRFQQKSKLPSSSSPNIASQSTQEKKKARNAIIADAVKKGACFGCGQTGHQIKDCPKKKTKKPQARPSVQIHEISGNCGIIQVEIHHLAHSSCTNCTFSTKVFDKHDLLRFPEKINGHDVTVLFDNGSSHNFVDAKLMQELNLQTQASDHEYRVKMARGEDTDVWNHMVPHLELELADYKENVDFHIMRLDRADVILGIPWFYDKQDSLYIDYVHHSLVFVKQDMPHVSLLLCYQIFVNNGFAIRVVTALEMFKDTKSSDVDFYQCVPSTWFDSHLFLDKSKGIVRLTTSVLRIQHGYASKGTQTGAEAGFGTAYSSEEIEKKISALRAQAEVKGSEQDGLLQKVQNVVYSNSLKAASGVVELYLQTRKAIEDQVKGFAAPTSDKLLPDLLPQERHVFTLAIDLNETLVYSDWTRDRGWKTFKRPGAEAFLEHLAQFYELVIYTDQLPFTVDPILEKLDQKQCIRYRLAREATQYIHGKHYKDLSKLNRDPAHVMFLSAHAKETCLQPENAVPVKPWKLEPDDTHLLDMLPFLEYVARYRPADVRSVLASYDGHDIPSEFLVRTRDYQKKMRELKSQNPFFRGSR